MITAELKSFIGKPVVNTATNRRFLLREITSPEIKVVTTEPESSGYYGTYVYKTINGDPFSTGLLIFEDPSLNQPFQEAYKAYCCSKDAFWEEYGYWMRRD